MATRTTASLFLCLPLFACGARTTLHDHGAGRGDGGSGGAGTSTSAGTGMQVDPCEQPLGRTVLATLPPGPFADNPEHTDIHSAQVFAGTLYLANFGSVYSLPVCGGGGVTLLFSNPDGGLEPNVPDYFFGSIGAMAINEFGIYWWANYGSDGENPHLWRTTLDGASTKEVPTTFAYPAMVAGPGGVWLVDPAVRRIEPDDTIQYLGSAAPLHYVSLPAFDAKNVYFSGAIEDPIGPLFRIPQAGGDLVVSAPQPWISEIVSDGTTLYGLRPGNPSAIVRIDTDGTQNVIADGQPWAADELHLVGSTLIFRDCGAIWAVEPTSGAVTLAHGEPKCYPPDPGDDPIYDAEPKTSVIATDAHAFYTFEGNQVVRVRLE
ncbi:MAG: hypothetical protein U0414_35100 [Polyangiaceae bacterium]